VFKIFQIFTEHKGANSNTFYIPIKSYLKKEPKSTTENPYYVFQHSDDSLKLLHSTK